MGELDTYRLSDLIPFGVDAYDRLFAAHGARFFPASVLGLCLGLLALWAALRGRGRWVGALLALSWAWVGWAWYATSYVTLNWAGERMAWLAFGYAAMIGSMAWRGWLDGSAGGRRDAIARRLGAGIAVAGLALYPLLDPLASDGRAWAGVEIFGHAPEPTAIVTLGLALAIGRWRAAALMVPTLVCLEGALTARVLATPGWWVSIALAALAWLALATTARSGTARPALGQ